ncbi:MULTISPECIES: hypothetical protein [unclassified Polaribacter]|uniref:hypothetical protein n=1 Tax=unclassified Polaribacter TaxID=196858 RepID=UPI0011BF46E8|nr:MULTISPECIES: hypothetical protein [unclassified Polaribacter]TXD54292.1 hypothetical protein ES043_00110 [Polaribacter sp. IC063]
MSNEKLPAALNGNRCLALFVSVVDESSMLSIKNAIEIKDCFGNTVYKSKTGKSRLKEYQKGYQEAIRNAFDTMDDFEYQYNSTQLAQVSNDTISNQTSLKSADKKVIFPVVSAISELKEQDVKQVKLGLIAVDVLYAQAIENGFQ